MVFGGRWTSGENVCLPKQGDFLFFILRQWSYWYSYELLFSFCSFLIIMYSLENEKYK